MMQQINQMLYGSIVLNTKSNEPQHALSESSRPIFSPVPRVRQEYWVYRISRITSFVNIKAPNRTLNYYKNQNCQFAKRFLNNTGKCPLARAYTLFVLLEAPVAAKPGSVLA
jgi:hypothetical protein